MTKYKYVLTFENGETIDSYEEHGDDDFEGTFSSYDAAVDAALYAISCCHTGAEILNMKGDEDEEYDESEDITYEIIEIDV